MLFLSQSTPLSISVGSCSFYQWNGCKLITTLHLLISPCCRLERKMQTMKSLFFSMMQHCRAFILLFSPPPFCCLHLSHCACLCLLTPMLPLVKVRKAARIRRWGKSTGLLFRIGKREPGNFRTCHLDSNISYTICVLHQLCDIHLTLVSMFWSEIAFFLHIFFSMNQNLHSQTVSKLKRQQFLSLVILIEKHCLFSMPKLIMPSTK